MQQTGPWDALSLPGFYLIIALLRQPTPSGGEVLPLGQGTR